MTSLRVRVPLRERTQAMLAQRNTLVAGRPRSRASFGATLLRRCVRDGKRSHLTAKFEHGRAF
jgi:hypothetical protein